jgi:hypothetical protein
MTLPLRNGLRSASQNASLTSRPAWLSACESRLPAVEEERAKDPRRQIALAQPATRADGEDDRDRRRGGEDEAVHRVGEAEPTGIGDAGVTCRAVPWLRS